MPDTKHTQDAASRAAEEIVEYYPTENSPTVVAAIIRRHFPQPVAPDDTRKGAWMHRQCDADKSALLAENARLREALERVCETTSNLLSDVVEKAAPGRGYAVQAAINDAVAVIALADPPAASDS